MPNDCKGQAAVPFDKVLEDELGEIEAAREERKVEQPVPGGADPMERARGAGLIGLALSGGGIRSATFNLGVLQALAEKKLLAQIDYLSTVSGGGYIGAWLISLLRNCGQPDQMELIQETLGDAQSHKPEAKDQRPIHFLRQYSNYLTPRFSALSADVWTMGACWMRNSFLNFLLLVSCTGVMLTAARLLAGIPRNLAVDSLLAQVFLLLTVVSLGINLRKRNAGQAVIQWVIVIPAVLGSYFLARWIGKAPGEFLRSGFLDGMWRPFAALCVLFLVVAWAGEFWNCFGYEHIQSKWKLNINRILLLVLVTVLPAFLTALVLWAMAYVAKHLPADYRFPGGVVTLGVPAVTTILSLGVVFQLGLMGRDFREDGREWFARLRAWSLIYSIGWAVFFSASLYGPLAVVLLLKSHALVSLGLTSGWVTTTLLGVLGGKSSASSGKSGGGGSAGGGDSKLDLIIRVAPFVFMAGFILIVASGVHFLLSVKYSPSDESKADARVLVSGVLPAVALIMKNPAASADDKTDLAKTVEIYLKQLSDGENHLWRNGFPDLLVCPWGLSLLFTIVIVVLSLRLDINVFSLHEFYKNRLVRCYLGAGRTRKPDPFTKFDEADDTPLPGFNARSGGHYYGPYPIINATLNISSGQDLASQQRKSAAWIFSPLYSGYNTGIGNEAARLGISELQEKSAAGGYRRTEDLCCPQGLRLGTAIAVSGAATSPNQGYHTSTAVAFLMTVFDVRLGWWIGNPRRNATFNRATPRFNLVAMLSELFGSTNTSSAYVNLSDGGHFDNMGLYELVRRRCRYIIVSDAEQDGDLSFGSLTTTIRNCRMDFGVEVNILLDRIAKNDKGFSGTHCVVGTIKYPEDENPAYLLYLKSSLTGDEPADVLGYRAGHAEFPHQSTGNQWFTEAQFESYRRLGNHVASTALSGIREKPANRAEYFRALHQKWYPPSTRVDEFSSKHAELFTGLTSPLGDDDRLSNLDSQIFTHWNDGDPDLAGDSERKAIYRASLLISFMHTVYTDLSLASKGNQDHPHNQGWMRIFRHWAREPMFQDTWKRTGPMYGDGFRQFYADLLKEE